MSIVIILLTILGISAVIASMFKSGHFIKSILTTAFQGITSLLAVNVVGLITGVSIAINWYTITTASVFGIPSSITFLILNTIFR